MCIANKTRTAGMVLALVLAGCGPKASELWSEHCTECHGPDGRGVEARRAFYPRVDLTRSPLIADHARGSIYQRVAFGWGTMPGFKHKLEPRELNQLVDFAIELVGRQTASDPPPATPVPDKPDRAKPGDEP